MEKVKLSNIPEAERRQLEEELLNHDYLKQLSFKEVKKLDMFIIEDMKEINLKMIDYTNLIMGLKPGDINTSQKYLMTVVNEITERKLRLTNFCIKCHIDNERSYFRMAYDRVTNQYFFQHYWYNPKALVKEERFVHIYSLIMPPSLDSESEVTFLPDEAILYANDLFMASLKEGNEKTPEIDAFMKTYMAHMMLKAMDVTSAMDIEYLEWLKIAEKTTPMLLNSKDFMSKITTFIMTLSISQLFIILYIQNCLDEEPVVIQKERKRKPPSTTDEHPVPPKPASGTNIITIGRKVKYHYTDPESIHKIAVRKNKRHTESWKVMGHWRTYKSGKRVFIPEHTCSPNAEKKEAKPKRVKVK